MNASNLYTLREVQSAYRAQQSAVIEVGGEHNQINGPCPNCGGHDRFRIKQIGQKLIVQCSKECSTFGEYLKLLMGDAKPGGAAFATAPDSQFVPPPRTLPPNYDPLTAVLKSPKDAIDGEAIHPPFRDGGFDVRYVYEGANSLASLIVYRYTKSDGRKSIAMYGVVEAPNRTGLVHLKRRLPTPRPLYRLPELRESRRIIVVEGEKCANALRVSFAREAISGVSATTWPGGAGNWNLADWSPLVGKDVIFWRDNDEPGKEAQDGVAKHLVDNVGVKRFRAVGVPPEKPKGWDCADTKDTAEILSLLESASDFQVPDEPPADEPSKMAPAKPAKPAMPSAKFKWGDKSGRWESQFLWRGWLPKRQLTLLGGDAGAGKGVLMASIVAMATGSRLWPDNTSSSSGIAIWVGDEDDHEETLGPRLDAAKAVPRRWAQMMNPPDDYKGSIADLLSGSVPDGTQLIVVDPLIQGMHGDINSATQTRAVTAAWAAVARRHACAVVGIMHNVKWKNAKAQTGSLQDLICGSGQWVAAARCAWLLLRDEKDPNGPRLLYRVKSNFDVTPECMAYRCHGKKTGDVMSIGKFEPDPDGAEKARGLAEGRDDKISETDEAILGWLAARGGHGMSNECKKAVADETNRSVSMVGKRATTLIARGTILADRKGRGSAAKWRLPQ